LSTGSPILTAKSGQVSQSFKSGLIEMRQSVRAALIQKQGAGSIHDSHQFLMAHLLNLLILQIRNVGQVISRNSDCEILSLLKVVSRSRSGCLGPTACRTHLFDPLLRVSVKDMGFVSSTSLPVTLGKDTTCDARLIQYPVSTFPPGSPG
jgi:hypothetical protein